MSDQGWLICTTEKPLCCGLPEHYCTVPIVLLTTRVLAAGHKRVPSMMSTPGYPGLLNPPISSSADQLTIAFLLAVLRM